jgi:hypothetical protein
MKRFLVAAPAAAAVLLATAPAVAASAATSSPASSPAIASLPCHASMSNSHPKEHSTTYVDVHSAAHVTVTTVAYYTKYIKHKHDGSTNAKGDAAIAYDVKDIKPGFKVVVDVRVYSKTKRAGTCSTWFIPQH